MEHSELTEKLLEVTANHAGQIPDAKFADCFQDKFWGRYAIEKAITSFPEPPIVNFRDCDTAQAIWNFHTSSGDPLIVNFRKESEGQVSAQALTIEGAGDTFVNVMLINWAPVTIVLATLPELNF